MPQAVQALLNELVRGGLVDEPDLARALGTSVRSVSRWQRDETGPRRESEERLLEIKAVTDLLGEVLRDDPARLWLRSPIPALDFEKPLDLLQRGEYRRVIAAVLALAEGVTA